LAASLARYGIDLAAAEFYLSLDKGYILNLLSNWQINNSCSSKMASEFFFNHFNFFLNDSGNMFGEGMRTDTIFAVLLQEYGIKLTKTNTTCKNTLYM